MSVKYAKRKGEHINGKDLYCCPWHEEETPSLIADPYKGTFLCSSCGLEGYIVGDPDNEWREEYGYTGFQLAEELGFDSVLSSLGQQ